MSLLRSASPSDEIAAQAAEGARYSANEAVGVALRQVCSSRDEVSNSVLPTAVEIDEPRKTTTLAAR